MSISGHKSAHTVRHFAYQDYRLHVDVEVKLSAIQILIQPLVYQHYLHHHCKAWNNESFASSHCFMTADL
jgi:hypothetical protein